MVTNCSNKKSPVMTGLFLYVMYFFMACFRTERVGLIVFRHGEGTIKNIILLAAIAP